MLLRRAEEGAVFFKDMAYYVMPHILSDRAFVDRLTHVFLIRDPVASILSYHKLDPEVTRDEIGLEAQWRLFDGLRGMGADPAVIEAEAVQRDTRGGMAALWARIGLPYREEAFDWSRAAPEEWEQVGNWHGAVSQSTGIRPVDADAVARKGLEFDTLSQSVPHLADYLAHHRPYYARLQAAALQW